MDRKLNEKYFKVNQALWEEKTSHHAKSKFYDVPAFKAGKNSLNFIELEALGPVEGKSILHLQCHFGQDSISLARMGAQVTAMDFSKNAIALGRSLNEELGQSVKFIETNIYDLKDKLTDQFDIVFTSYGVINWLPDLKEWASIINHYLKPGGTFYTVEFHPALFMYEWDPLRLEFDYFERKEPYLEVVEGSYADQKAPIKSEEYFFPHSIGETLQPLVNTGLKLKEFKEYPFSTYNCFPNMIEIAPGKYTLKIKDVTFPHLFSIKMSKEET